MSADHLTDHRSTARAVGALFILASATAVIGGSLIVPITEDGADLVTLRGQVATGALLEVLLALSVVAIAVLLFPLLRGQHEGLALGYAALRTLEGGFVLIAATSALVAVNLDATVPEVLFSAREWSYFVGTMLIFGVSAALLNMLLLQSRLIPRWLAGWGLLGAVLLLARTGFELYGVESSLGVQFVWAAPIALQEMVFAIWLLVKGFDSSRVRAPARTGNTVRDAESPSGAPTAR